MLSGIGDSLMTRYLNTFYLEEWQVKNEVRVVTDNKAAVIHSMRKEGLVFCDLHLTLL